MQHFVELPNGTRLRCNDWQYQAFMLFHGYIHWITGPGYIVIKKG